MWPTHFPVQACGIKLQLSYVFLNITWYLLMNFFFSDITFTVLEVFNIRQISNRFVKQTEYESLARWSINVRKSWLVSQLALWAQSTTKDYIMAKNKPQFVSYLFCIQVIKPQPLQNLPNQSWHKSIQIKACIHKHKTQHFQQKLVPSILPLCLSLIREIEEERKKRIHNTKQPATRVKKLAND